MVQNSCLGSGGGGGLASDSVAMVFDYNDVWQNYPNDYYGCTAGPHALSLDPLFVVAPFGDYCLSQTAAGQPDNSPCLDAGDTLLMVSPLNLDSLIHAWTTRTDTAPDEGVPDIGYHYALVPSTGITAAATRRQLEPGLRLAPNPARGKQVRVVGGLGWSVAVFDASGRLVLSQRLSPSDGRALLDISRLSAGVYLVQTELSSRTVRGRLLVQRGARTSAGGGAGISLCATAGSSRIRRRVKRGGWRQSSQEASPVALDTLRTY